MISRIRRKYILIIMFLLVLALFVLALVQITKDAGDGDVGVTDPTTGLCSVIYGGEDLREYGGVYLQRGAQLIDANPIATLSGNYIGGTDNVFASHPLENLDIAFYSALTTASATFENHLITMLEAGKPVVLITDGSQYSRKSPFDLIEKFGVNIAGNNYIGVLPIEETAFTRSSLSGLENLGFSTGALLSDGGETGIYADKSEFTCQYTIPGKPNECVFAEVIYNGASGPTSLFIMTNIITTGHTAGVRGATFEEYDAAATNFLDKVLNFACTDYVYPECNDGLDNDGDGLIDCQTGAEDPGCYPDGMGGGGTCDPNDESEAGECGNGVVEAGEECDNNESWCVQCVAQALECTSESATIDFEDFLTNYRNPDDSNRVTNQYAPSTGITFSTEGCGLRGAPRLALYNKGNEAEVYIERNGVNAQFTEQLGTAFITDNYLQDPNPAPCTFAIDFERPTTEFSFDLVDADSTEQYVVTAYSVDGSVIGTETVTTNTPGAGHHNAYTVRFSANPTDKINRITVVYGIANIAFDNFSPYCSETPTNPECSDGIDNDGDGLVDCTAGAEDPGCFPDGHGGGGACNPNDDDETDTVTECSDGIDNDGDGFIDCTSGAEDPGCFPDGNGGGGACNPNDDDETNAVTECSDGIDNDGDGFIDCTSGAEDPGCFPNGNGGGGACNPQDDNEDDVPTECSDGIDNDGDGLIDCTSGAEDPGCFPDGQGGGGACNPSDNDEEDTPPECSDGIDNDGDGLTDCTSGAEDPGCFPDGNGGGGSCDPDDNDETDIALPYCGDGICQTGETCEVANPSSSSPIYGTCGTVGSVPGAPALSSCREVQTTYSAPDGDSCSYCGDGVVNAVYEQCDFNASGATNCNTSCQTVTPVCEEIVSADSNDTIADGETATFTFTYTNVNTGNPYPNIQLLVHDGDSNTIGTLVGSDANATTSNTVSPSEAPSSTDTSTTKTYRFEWLATEDDESTAVSDGIYTVSVLLDSTDNPGSLVTTPSACLQTIEVDTAETAEPAFIVTSSSSATCQESGDAQVDYTVTVTNAGEATGTLAEIVNTIDTDVYGSGIAPFNISDSGVYSAGTVTWDPAGISEESYTAGQSRTYTFSLTIPEDELPDYQFVGIDNQVTITDSGDDTATFEMNSVLDCELPSVVSTVTSIPATGVLDDGIRYILLGFIMILTGLIVLRYDIGRGKVQLGLRKMFYSSPLATYEEKVDFTRERDNDNNS